MSDLCSGCAQPLPNDTGTYCPRCGQPRRAGRVNVLPRAVTPCPAPDPLRAGRVCAYRRGHSLPHRFVIPDMEESIDA